MGYILNKAPSDGAEVNSFKLGSGDSYSEISINGKYPYEILRRVGVGENPPRPEVGFEGTIGNGPYGIKIITTVDSFNGEKHFSVSGSFSGVGVSTEFTLDADNNVISSSGFGGVQFIGGQKLVVFGIPFGAEGIVKLGLEIDNNGIAINAEGKATIGFIFGEADVNSSTKIPIYDFKDSCFLAGTLIEMADGTIKIIEEIMPGDTVLSYDHTGILVPGHVVRTFRNEVKHILDVFGLMVTPGHSTFCGAGKYAGRHVPILDILRTDGALVRSDGSLIRAATGCAVESYEDQFVQLAIGECGSDGTIAPTHQGKIRIGTRFITDDGKDIAVADLLKHAGAVVNEDGLVTGPNINMPMPLHLSFLSCIPLPEDYVLQRSGVTLEEIYRASEWEEGARPVGFPPMHLDGGPVKPAPQHDRQLIPRNIPLAFRKCQNDAAEVLEPRYAT